MRVLRVGPVPLSLFHLFVCLMPSFVCPRYNRLRLNLDSLCKTVTYLLNMQVLVTESVLCNQTAWVGDLILRQGQLPNEVYQIADSQNRLAFLQLFSWHVFAKLLIITARLDERPVVSVEVLKFIVNIRFVKGLRYCKFQSANTINCGFRALCFIVWDLDLTYDCCLIAQEKAEQ